MNEKGEWLNNNVNNWHLNGAIKYNFEIKKAGSGKLDENSVW